VINALSIDVEEYFHPTEVQDSFGGPDNWATLPSRLQQPMDNILDLLHRHNVKATFFILGWVAKHHPRLVAQVADAGHQIGCHSYAHRLVYDLTATQFREDTKRAIGAIEDACGQSPQVYRAPSYSITARSMWALEILVECGFTHDSSIYPISHDRYGIPNFGRNLQRLDTHFGPIYEIPVAAAQLFDRWVTPVGGGAYLRLLPYAYTAAGIRWMNQKESMPACIYFHPWEIDPQQPRLASGRVSRWRTHTGVKGMYGKLQRLLTDFQFSTIAEAYQGVKEEPIPQRNAVSVG
jgi:polysaccharide deacetylase family protein (PEP-CTERM system associated)